MVGFLCLAVHSGFHSRVPDVRMINVLGGLKGRKAEVAGWVVAVFYEESQLPVEREPIRGMLLPG